MPEPYDATREAALALMASGEATMAEIAELAGVSRQLVRYWAQRAELEPVEIRRARLERLWQRRIERY